MARRAEQAFGRVVGSGVVLCYVLVRVVVWRLELELSMFFYCFTALCQLILINTVLDLDAFRLAPPHQHRRGQLRH